MTGVEILCVLLIAAAVSVWYIKRQIKKASRQLFGTDSVKEIARQFEEQERIMEETPKSVAGMTSYYLPKIQRDFPEFSYQQFVQRTENCLKAALASIEKESLSELSDESEELKKQIQAKLNDHERQGIREKFHSVKIHRTEISHYVKEAGCCMITFQSAVEYLYAQWNRDEECPKLKKRQTRYQMEWVYIQDAEAMPEERRAVGFTCPNCGAPIKKLGSRSCEYCGTALEPINIRVWSLDRILEKNHH